MKKLSIILMLLIGIAFLGFAQTGQTKMEIDSLTVSLKGDISDSTKMVYAYELGRAYLYFNNDSTSKYLSIAFDLAKRLKRIDIEARVVADKAFLVGLRGNYPEAMQILQNAKKEYKLEDYPEAKFSIHWALGNIYQVIKDYPRALEQRRISLLLSQKDFSRNLGSLSSLTRLFAEMGQYDSAQFYFRILHDSLEGSSEQLSVNNNSVIAQSLNALKEYERALPFARNAFAQAENGDGGNHISFYAINLARTFDGLHRKDSAIHYATICLENAEKMSFLNFAYQACDLLAALHEDIDQKAALAYYKKASSIQGRIMGTSQLQSINAVMDQISRQEQALKDEKSKMNQRAMLGGMLALSIIGFLLWSNNRKKQKANKILNEKKSALEETLIKLQSTQAQLIQSEKMASLGELTAGIAHEIQNPLNFVNNFSELNMELIDELTFEADRGDLEEVKVIAKDIKENEQKITHHGKRADAIVKGMLEHSRASSGERAPTDINALADEYLRLSFHGLRAKDKSFNADFETNFDPNLPKVNVVPQDIGRVLLNIFNNAFQACTERYALSGVEASRSAPSQGDLPSFVGEDKGNQEGLTPIINPKSKIVNPLVTVTTKNLGDKIQISVSDNGPGIPDGIKDKIFQPFFTTKPTGQGTGLGLSLAYDIVKAHGGELTLDSNEEVGTQFTIKIPIA